MGIKRDDTRVWRRVSDGAEVNLDGWYPGKPYIGAKWDLLSWYFYDNQLKNTITNSGSFPGYFICEYEHLV